MNFYTLGRMHVAIYKTFVINNIVVWILNRSDHVSTAVKLPLIERYQFWTVLDIYNIHVFFSAPSSPRNVQLLSVTDTSIKISWWEPARANGVLLGYRVYFLHRNFTSVQTIRDNKSAMVETLTRLSKYFTQLTFKRNFMIWILSFLFR